MITLWAAERRTVDTAEFGELIESMADAHAAPLAAELVDIVAHISTEILRTPILRTAPQFVALGYWMRAAAIRRIVAEGRAAVPDGNVLAPRGLALHLPPANVDTIFVYSWVLSLLAGNSIVVGLPAKVSPTTEALLAIIVDALAGGRISSKNLFCTYPYGGEIEQRISPLFDLRIIWGGDEKVALVNKVPIRPDGLSIGFPDRQSVALISLEAYDRSTAEERDELAGRLFNDAYWFDQMGCSSPRLLAWIGTAVNRETLARDLYSRLQSVIERKGYEVAPSVAVAKLLVTNELLAEGAGHRGEWYSSELQVVDTAEPAAALKRGPGGGFFLECTLGDLRDVRLLVSRKLQTITHFGFDIDQLMELARGVAGIGAYRIVPVGQALDFNPTWDGVPLLSHMTRQIVVKAN
jgi:hypothetical protein